MAAPEFIDFEWTAILLSIVTILPVHFLAWTTTSMSSDLRQYIQAIRQRAETTGRQWYWEKNADRSKPLAYALEYNPITLLLKTRRYIKRWRMLAPLMVSNQPTEILRRQEDFHLVRDRDQANSLRIEIAPATDRSSTTIESPVKLPSGNRKLVILHAFYENEADAIFEKLDRFTDYDLLLSTPIPAIRDLFLQRFDPSRAACFLVPNAGRDVLPFLLLLAFVDLSGYRHFVKIHTKRSSHLLNGGKWFSMNAEILIGDPAMTDRIFDLIDPNIPSIYGVECRPLHDHFKSNRHWLGFLMPNPPRQWQGCFIPGTMFAGSAAFLRRLADLKLHLHEFEKENGQLDGCLIHALERYLGFAAQNSGGECATFDALLSRAAQ